MAIPSTSDGQLDRKPVSSELHKIILAKVQKEYKLLLKKIKSAFLVDMHIYTLCPSLLQSFTKFCWAVWVKLRWRIVLSSIFHFGQISKFKKGYFSQKKIESEFPVDMHIYMVGPSNYKVSWNSDEQFQSCVDKLFQKYLSFWSNF